MLVASLGYEEMMNIRGGDGGSTPPPPPVKTGTEEDIIL
jgi:hypothetical protein